MNSLGELAGAEPLLVLVIAAVLAAAAGWMIERDRPGTGKALRQTGYLAMLAAGLLLVGQLAYNAKRSDAALMLTSLPKASVVGGETVVPLAGDGHYWIAAEVNGKPHEFLVDTGATFTALSRRSAAALGVSPDGRMPIELGTANGPIVARRGTILELRFGSIAARDLDVVIGPDSGDDTDVLGMNFLSRLGSWRVEGDKLVLVPKQAQTATPDA